MSRRPLWSSCLFASACRPLHASMFRFRVRLACAPAPSHRSVASLSSNRRIRAPLWIRSRRTPTPAGAFTNLLFPRAIVLPRARCHRGFACSRSFACRCQLLSVCANALPVDPSSSRLPDSWALLLFPCLPLQVRVLVLRAVHPRAPVPDLVRHLHRQ